MSAIRQSPRFTLRSSTASPPLTPLGRPFGSSDLEFLSYSPPIGSKSASSSHSLLPPPSSSPTIHGHPILSFDTKSPSPSPPAVELFTPQIGSYNPSLKTPNTVPAGSGLGLDSKTPHSGSADKRMQMQSTHSPLNLAATPSQYPSYMSSDPPSLSASQLPASARPSSSLSQNQLYKSSYQLSPVFQQPLPRRSPRFNAMSMNSATPLFAGLSTPGPSGYNSSLPPYSPSFSSLPSPSLTSALRRSPRMSISGSGTGLTPSYDYLRSPALQSSLDPMSMPPSAAHQSASASHSHSSSLTNFNTPFNEPDSNSATIFEKLKQNNSSSHTLSHHKSKRSRGEAMGNESGRLNSMLMPPATPPLTGMYGSGFLNTTQSPPIFPRSMKSSDSLDSAAEFPVLKEPEANLNNSYASNLSRIPNSSSSLSTLSSAGNGAGSSCHQCKSRRSHSQLIFCGNQLNKKGKEKIRTHSCRKKYCETCLMKFYNEKPPDRRAPGNLNWQCPACRGLCCCAACRRQKVKFESAADILALSPASLLAYGLVYCPEIVHSTMRLDSTLESDRERVKLEADGSDSSDSEAPKKKKQKSAKSMKISVEEPKIHVKVENSNGTDRKKDKSNKKAKKGKKAVVSDSDRDASSRSASDTDTTDSD